jgi:nitrite reductase/ring-hydroxylating ferredoxin subunit
MTKAMFASEPGESATATATGTWRTIGTSRSVAEGDIKAFPQRDGPIAVANVGGTYFAIDDTCTHRRCSLAEGDLDGTIVTCICHGSEFDVTSGAVRRGPAETPVGSYPTRIEGSELQVQR